MGRNQLGTNGPSLPPSSLPPTVPDAFPSAPDGCPVLSLDPSPSPLLFIPFLRPHKPPLLTSSCTVSQVMGAQAHVVAAYWLSPGPPQRFRGWGGWDLLQITSQALSVPHTKSICSVFPRPKSPWGESTMSLSHFACKKNWRGRSTDPKVRQAWILPSELPLTGFVFPCKQRLLGTGSSVKMENTGIVNTSLGYGECKIRC